MATFSPGTGNSPSPGPSLVDWNTMIKPFVTYSVGTLSKHEFTSLIKGIIESKPELAESQSPDHPHKIFYDVVTVLSAHILTVAARSPDLLSRSSYAIASQVSKILCESLVVRFSSIVQSPHPIISCKTYINVIQELCSGSLILGQEDITGMLALLKNENLPSKIQSTAPSTWDKDGTSSSPSSSVKESRRSRLDPSVLLYDSIALPVLSIPSSKSVSEQLCEEVIRNFQSLRAAQKFVDYCLSLPSMKSLHAEPLNLTSDHIRSHYSKVVSKNSSPNFNLISEDLNFVYKLLSLPIFSPLAEPDAQRITELGISVLFSSFIVMQNLYGSQHHQQQTQSSSSGGGQHTGSTSTSGPHHNDEEYGIGIGIVSQVIWTEKRISEILKENIALPQKIWLNYSFIISKIILHCTHCYMHHVSFTGTSESKEKKPVPHHMSLIAVQSVWNELITAISKLGLELINNFINITSPLEESVQRSKLQLNTFTVNTDLSNCERIKALFGKSEPHGFNGIESLVHIITLSYRKACKLKMAKYTKHKSTKTSSDDESSAKRKRGQLSFSMSEDEDTDIKEPLAPSSQPTPTSTAPLGTAEVDVEIEDDGENRSASDFVTTDDEDDDVDVEEEEDEDDDMDDDDEQDNTNMYHDAVESDDEPILGKWFETVLSSVQEKNGHGEEALRRLEKDEVNGKGQKAEDAVESLVMEFIRDKSCPHGFIESALVTLEFLTKDVVSNTNPTVQEAAKSSFNEQMITLIALVMKDLDQEKACTEIGAISTFFDDRMNHLFCDFSNEIGKLVQNLIASNILSQIQISFLLDQLKIDLSGNGRWNFGLYPKSLAVLVQVLLLKPEKDVIIVSLLKRFLDTLVHDIVTPNQAGYADLPVEHAQTLAFLFHSLSLMQKKTIMIETSQALIRASKNVGVLRETSQVLSLSRLLLFFDYFLRQLYEPEIKLIQQVQYNLFNEENALPADVLSKCANSLMPSRLNFDCEMDYGNVWTGNETSSTPKFYNLISSEPNYQENPKLDGLSMNFLMNKNDANFKDKMNYSEVIEALFTIMETEITLRKDPGSLQYFEILLNRIIFSLPPPWELIEKVTDPEALKRFSVVLYLLIWLPRLTNRTFASWIRDVFSKQGLNTAGSEELIQRTINVATEPRFHIRILNACNIWLEKLQQLKGKLPGMIYGIESVLVHVKYNLLVNMDIITNPTNSEDKDGPPEKTEVELHNILREILTNSKNALARVLLSNVKLPEPENQKVLERCISITSEYFIGNSIASVVLKHLASPYKQVLESMKEVMPVTQSVFPPYAQGGLYQSDCIPCESYLRAIINGHYKLNNITISVKHILGSVIQLLSIAIESKTLLPEGGENLLGAAMVPLLLDKSTEYCADMIGKGIDPTLYGKRDVTLSPTIVAEIYLKTIRLLVDENGLRKLVDKNNWDKFVESAFDALNVIIKTRGKGDEESIRNEIFKQDEKLVKDLLKFSAATNSASVLISGLDVAKFLLTTTSPDRAHKLLTIVAEVLREKELVKSFFCHEFFKSKRCTEATQSFFQAIQNLMSIVDLRNDESLCNIIPNLIEEIITIVNANMIQKDEEINEKHHSFCIVITMLITMANLNSSVGTEVEMSTLSSPNGHAKLFKEMANWFGCYMSDAESFLEDSLKARELLSTEKSSPGKSGKVSSSSQDYFPGKLKALELILEYMLDVGRSIQFYQNNGQSKPREREWTPGSGTITPPNDWDDLDNFDSEYGYNIDDPEDEESGVDDSDEESLNNRLCTYTITQKEFMSQHWYHCHSCGMYDRVGVCSICARVCHRGHDVTYSKFGSFFCDCGARPNGTCIAMSRRTSNTTCEFPPTINGTPVPQPLSSTSANTGSNQFQSVDSTNAEPCSTNRRSSPPPSIDTKDSLAHPKIKINPAMWIELFKEFKEFVGTISEATLDKIYCLVKQLSAEKTSIGAFKRVQEALNKLRSGLNHELEFTLKTNDELVQQYLSSQENAFENTKLQFNGDQGATIRQLVNTAVIRRNAIMTLSAPTPRRCFLAVSHEKGKLYILQLGSLLSGGDVRKGKLQIPRLGSVTLPFTCLTMSSNPIRDDALAVCGLKDCQVVVIGTGGTILNQITLKVGLDNQNYIIKPMWIPGSQTELALLTSDGVKIYDLFIDPEEPTYHFLLPSGKVRDATFVVEDKSRFILLMGTDGRIYSEKLDANTSAVNGPYYITNDLNYDDTEILSQEANNANSSNSSTTAEAAKGVSLYYSHSLRLLFYTYPNGKSYVGTLENLNTLNPLTKGFLITPNNSSKPANLGLCLWNEVFGHPGLIFAMGANSVPYALFITPNGSQIQEIRLPGKVKPVDIVSLRHNISASPKFRTSALVLCDDGSLKVQTANEITEYWLSARLRPHGDLGQLKSPSSYGSGQRATISGPKLVGINKRMAKYTRMPGGQLIFAADFFEHCQLLTEIEFGGNDLLQVYNSTQLKTRLADGALYIVSSKSIGFNLEISSTDGSMVITGIRVNLGVHDVTRNPSFIQVHGRTITVAPNRQRWYDIPLTREESLHSDQKLTVTFGPSSDPASITVVDTVKVYGKTKEAFAWPDDTDEVISGQANGTGQLVPSCASGILDKSMEEAITEKIILNALDLCDIGLTITPKPPNEMSHILDTVTKIYLENYPTFNSTCRTLMNTVFQNRSAFNDHRDKSVLSHCLSVVMSLDEKLEQDIDPELFHHLVMCIKNIAIARPSHILSYSYEDIGHGPMNITRVVETLCNIFMKLVKIRPKNLFVVAVDRTGIQRISHVAWALTEIIYAVMSTDIQLVEKLSPCLIRLLLSKDPEISIPIKSVFIKRMRPKTSRKRRSTLLGITEKSLEPSSRPSRTSNNATSSTVPPSIHEPSIQPPLPMDEGILDESVGEQPLLIDGYMVGEEDADAYPPVIDIQSDAEDEAMVELAIALSLQEQAGGAALAIQNLQEGLQVLENIHHDVLQGADPLSPPDDMDDDDDDEDMGIPLGSHEHGMDPSGGAESDATASPPASDDEGSTAATVGSTMRNEQGGSESSGSSTGAGGMGRGRTRRRHPAEASNPASQPILPPIPILPETNSDNGTIAGSMPCTSTTGTSSAGTSQGTGTVSTFIVPNKPFRIALLRAMSKEVLSCESAMSLIPLLQIAIHILSDLDGTTEDECNVVEELMKNLVNLMHIEETTRQVDWKRTNITEMSIVILRMFSLSIAKLRSTEQKVENFWIARITAMAIQSLGIVGFCKELLHSLRQTWKGLEPQESSTVITQSSSPSSGSNAAQVPPCTTLKPAQVSSAPDLHPFFLKQYVKSHSTDLLEELPILISEMALRLPYQIKKILPQAQLFDKEWDELLCEVLQSKYTPCVRRQARKLLLTIAGSRDVYHFLRDVYHINYNLNEFKKLIGYSEEKLDKKKPSEFKYSQLVSMVEYLNSCIDIAGQRPASWQNYCRSTMVLNFIVEISCSADESLTTSILTLVKIAIDGVTFDSKASIPEGGTTKDSFLTHMMIDFLDKRAFLEFVRKFLLEHPQLSTRWNAHSLLYGIFSNSDNAHQLKLINVLWELWPFVPAAGSRASQFVDILGYATLNNDELKARDLREHVNRLVCSIEQQGSALLAHPNANIYSSLVPFVSVDGYYLESEPCEICYNVDKAYSSQKLSSVKADAKFTANHQFIKLTSTLNIVRLSLRLTEIKKARMIKSMGIYYSPKNISIVELKNHRSLWQLAKKANLTQSQTEVKLDFSVPITASNIIIEFSDFYENAQGTSENLQCPRCSASVPSQPGVCSNCGENVYQCHKCRAINYDERDPFLCHSCGFCKYAKMDISLLSKNIVAVDPIENEEDHKKAEGAINSFLEKADQTYKNQQQIKAMLETMLQSIKEKRSMAGLTTTLGSAPPSATITITNNATGSGSGHAAQTYASVAAAANAVNALNNNIAVLSVGGDRSGQPTISAANAQQLMQAAAAAANASAGGVSHTTTSVPVQQPGTSASTSLVLKNVQSLAYCYAIDCKNSYEELNRVMRKVGVYRKELLKLDPTAYPLDTMENVTFRRCYGCMAASITQSLKLLQALITAGSPRDPFDLSFLSFLLRLSQAAGSTALKEQVKNALCFFVKDDETATSQLTDMITNRVVSAFSKETWSDLSFETSEEISLLASLLQMYDACWEIKLRSLMKIFTHAVRRLQDPFVTETCLLPCLKIIQNFIHVAIQKSDKAKQGSIVNSVECVSINLEDWMAGRDSYEQWRKRLPKLDPNATSTAKSNSTATTSKTPKKKDVGPPKKDKKKESGGTAKPNKKDDKAQQRQNYLMNKFGRLWIEKHFKLNLNRRLEFDSTELNWVRKLIFSSGSIQTRVVTAGLLKDMAQVPSRKLKIMELLMHFMKDLPKFGESCREFMELFRTLATPSEYSAFLNAKGALNIVCDLLDQEIDKLHQLESITLHSDLSQGVAVWELSRLLSTLAIPSVCRTKRKSLLSTVLGGYLALKRLRLHRTRSVNEAQEILLTLLEAISKGTEEETKEFMSVCIDTLKKCPKDDLTTPVFIFERLCSLIVHEESDVAEFYVSLEKDPQQEDFLQGRMLGNPYSSNDSGIGPLMRDIKNKICTDCELVALLEDDNGMELLVNNKIMSLDLPVKEVYKRIWLPTNGQVEPMRIVYRMRGLMGDATEEFIETFTSASDGDQDYETIYKLANVLVQSEGLKVVLSSLQNLLGQPFIPSRGKPFIAVILKLLGYAAKIKNGRVAFVAPDLNAIPTLLPILELCLEHDLHCIQGSSGVVHLSDQVLEILDTILIDAYALEEEVFQAFAKYRGSVDDIRKLLQLTDKLKGKQLTQTTHLKVLGCLTFSEKDKMNLIFDNYTDCWDFFKFDDDSGTDANVKLFDAKLEQICTMVSTIQHGKYGRTFKDLAIERGVVERCLDYIRKRAPNLSPPMGRPDSDEWKEMVSKPALKYVLRLLAGLATDHEPTQESLSECIHVIHQLEQVSSDEHVGSLAENTMEALRSHEKIWAQVEAARRATREEKKRLAMAMRQRQLNAIGMKTNDKGQVTAATAGTSILDQMEDFAEESGLVCVICREGYKYQPAKVLGIYTYSKRCAYEESEAKSRKSYGYCTVSHFNVVHVDCHMAAIRLARARDEWESASLQNGNTRCNGLIPLWGQQVPESAFAACLARHNAYLQEATGHRDVGFTSGVHDIKFLLLRFAEEKSFHEDTGGGGPESNCHLIPYLFHTALYVLNTTRSGSKESSSLERFLNQPSTNWKEDLNNVEGPYYNLVVGLMVQPPAKWMESRVLWLKRIMTMGGYRSKRLASAEYVHYRPGLIFLGLIHGLYTIVFKDVSGTGEWSTMLADYIRKNDEALLKSTTALLNMYQQKLLQASSVEDMIEVLGLSDVEEVKDIGNFITNLWSVTV